MLGNKTEAGDIVVCGAVNSRNQFGGMTDYVPFIGGWRSGQTAYEFRVTAIGGRDASPSVVLKTCQDFGIY